VTRKQLTLFVPQHHVIEEIRERFNPVQHGLITAHITLCREDEIEEIGKVIPNIEKIQLNSPLILKLNAPERFDNGKGVFISAGPNAQFDALRKRILEGIIASPRPQLPHLTLMHPRNSICNDTIFNQIKTYNLPTSLSFDTISLIEQVDDRPWKILARYQITK
jgi:hypothetical protein